MMIMNWEEFPVGPNGFEDRLHVTMDKKGSIMIGAKAYEKLGRPEAAVLLFDKLKNVMGLLPINARAQNAYPFHKKSNGRHTVVRANRFCRHHGIRVDRTVAFSDPVIDGEGILVLDLKTTTGFGRV
jgi:hypothetical protein